MMYPFAANCFLEKDHGFSTGTAATAAALAACAALLDLEIPNPVPTPLPVQSDGVIRCLPIPLDYSRKEGEQGRACVTKDGGKDPDATHGARIEACIRRIPSENTDRSAILLCGGPGIGRVTLPGLTVPVGEAAINPTPRAQIISSLLALCRACKYTGGLELTLSVPEGETLACKTLNARLGIIGGISILGTQGTVIPYSHEAWQAVIVQGLHLARAQNLETICFSTGRRSERLLMQRYPALPELAFVQAADYAAFSLREAGRAGFQRIVWGCFFGKLVKLAQGLENTHAHTAPLDMDFLVRYCRKAGICPTTVQAIAACTTAGHALEILSSDSRAPHLLEALLLQAQQHAQTFSAHVAVTIHLFHMNGTELASA